MEHPKESRGCENVLETARQSPASGGPHLCGTFQLKGPVAYLSAWYHGCTNCLPGLGSPNVLSIFLFIKLEGLGMHLLRSLA